jgi:threonine dehydratase
MSHRDALFTLQDLRTGAVRGHRIVAPTPQYAWARLAAAIGCGVWVTHENHAPTGAFKVRGGLVYMDALHRANPAVSGVSAAAGGDHGQSVAFSAARAGLTATVFVPIGTA